MTRTKIDKIDAQQRYAKLRAKFPEAPTKVILDKVGWKATNYPAWVKADETQALVEREKLILWQDMGKIQLSKAFGAIAKILYTEIIDRYTDPKKRSEIPDRTLLDQFGKIGKIVVDLVGDVPEGLDENLEETTNEMNKALDVPIEIEIGGEDGAESTCETAPETDSEEKAEAV